MARPRSFDIDTALDAALDVFWSHGFEATSITDLTDAMGIQRGSLYQAFGDKKALFLQAMDRYLRKGRATSREALQDAASPMEGLRAWFELMFASCPSRKGCFAVNSTVELAAHDSDVAKVTSSHWRQMEALLVETIERGQTDGEIRDDLTPRDISRLLLSTLAGAQALDRQKTRRDVSPASFAGLLSTLLSS